MLKPYPHIIPTEFTQDEKRIQNMETAMAYDGCEIPQLPEGKREEISERSIARPWRRVR
jgi:hypothetical protein